MVVPPAVLSAQKKAKASYSSVISSPAPPVASTSALPAEAAQEDDEEGAEPWQSKGDAEMQDGDDDDDAVMIDSNSLMPSTGKTGGAGKADTVATESGSLSFPALSAKELQGKVETQTRKVSIAPHRMTPLKRDWPKIYSPLVDECGLMVRMNPNKKRIEIKTSKHTPAPSNTILQRAVDFITAYSLGFSAEDAVAILRMEELYIESFEIKDVKTLTGDHLSRAIGRIAGKDGKTRFTIENVSKTRIVLADQKIHILGTFSSIKIARDAICNLILGSTPGKVYSGLTRVAARQKQRF